MEQHPLIVENLTKKFETRTWLWPRVKSSFTAVNNISFSLKQGEILGFLGPNGAGKTTTIQMLLNLLTPTSGSITYFGNDFMKNRSVMQQIAYVSGYMKLPSSLTVKQVLFMQGLLYDMKISYLKSKIETYLDLFNLRHLQNRNVTTLSSGQTTSVLLARAFLVDPKIVLLDEPTAALDPDTASNVRSFIDERNKTDGISILFTSHNMPEVAELCDRILVLKDGKIVADNTPEYLASTVSMAHVQLMIGDGLKRTIAYAQESGLEYKVEKRHIEIKIDEHKISEFLSELAKQGIYYTQISIEKPTLEDYFINLVGKNEEEK